MILIRLLTALAVWLGLSTTVALVVVLVGSGTNSRAVILMGAGLVVVWFALGGTLMHLARDRERAFIEEAITTGMTNLAPLFGVPSGAAHITIGTFVYGLMVYLPACCMPAEHGARPPRWWHFPLAVVFPFVFAIPVAGVIETATLALGAALPGVPVQPCRSPHASCRGTCRFLGPLASCVADQPVLVL